MDTVDPKVLDRWIAYFKVKADAEKKKTPMSKPEELAARLKVSHG